MIENYFGYDGIALASWLPCPFVVRKAFQNFLFMNHKAYDIETWYVALGTWTHYFVYIMDMGRPWPILGQGQTWPSARLFGRKC